MKKIFGLLGILALFAAPSMAVVVSSSSASSTGARAFIPIQPKETVRYTINASTGSVQGTVQIQRSRDAVNWENKESIGDLTTSTSTGVLFNDTGQTEFYRLNITTITGGAYDLRIEDVDDVVQVFKNNKGVDSFSFYDDTIRFDQIPVYEVKEITSSTGTNTIELSDLGAFTVFSDSTTFSGVPSISTANVTAGTILTFQASVNTITFQDESAVTNSALELGASSRALGAGDILQLIYRDSKWWELTFTNN